MIRSQGCQLTRRRSWFLHTLQSWLWAVVVEFMIVLLVQYFDIPADAADHADEGASPWALGASRVGLALTRRPGLVDPGLVALKEHLTGRFEVCVILLGPLDDDPEARATIEKLESVDCFVIIWQIDEVDWKTANDSGGRHTGRVCAEPQRGCAVAGCAILRHVHWSLLLRESCRPNVAFPS